MDLVVFVVSMADLISCGAIFVWKKMKVQEQGWRLVGVNCGVLLRRHRRHAADLGFEEHGDDPRLTRHSDNGLASGKPFLRLTKPLRAMVFLCLRRRQVATIAIAEICFNGVFLQTFVDMRPLSFSIMVYLTSCCNLTYV